MKQILSYVLAQYAQYAQYAQCTILWTRCKQHTVEWTFHTVDPKTERPDNPELANEHFNHELFTLCRLHEIISPLAKQTKCSFFHEVIVGFPLRAVQTEAPVQW